MTTEAEPNLVLLQERLMTAIADIRPFAKDAATRKRLGDIERQVRKIVAENPVVGGPGSHS